MSESPVNGSVGALNGPQWVQHTLAGDIFHLMFEMFFLPSLLG